MGKGMDICRTYFYEVCYPVLETEFKTYLPRMAAGMIGEGSECYGFDDEISRDHNFGPSFQIYIPGEDMAVYGEELKIRLAHLPGRCQDAGSVSNSAGGQIDVFAIEDFYKKHIGVEAVPERMEVWSQIPEQALSAATNGEVFFDNYGRFSQIRDQLKKGYPEEIRLKKIAERLMEIAQIGQYDFPQSAQRREYAAAHMVLSDFMARAMSLVYLLNRTYSPSYKWMHRGLLELPILGEEIHEKFRRLAILSVRKEWGEMKWIVEETYNMCLEELKNQKLA